MTSTALPTPPDAGVSYAETPTHPDTQFLHDYWAEMRQGRSLPERADINLADLSRIAPHLLIVEPTEDRDDFRIRLFGSALTQITSEERTGMRLSEIGKESKEANIRARWTTITRQTFETGQPIFATATASRTGKEHLLYHVVALPLAQGGDKPAQVISAIFTTYRDGRAAR